MTCKKGVMCYTDTERSKLPFIQKKIRGIALWQERIKIVHLSWY